MHSSTDLIIFFVIPGQDPRVREAFPLLILTCGMADGVVRGKPATRSEPLLYVQRDAQPQGGVPFADVPAEGPGDAVAMETAAGLQTRDQVRYRLWYR